MHILFIIIFFGFMLYKYRKQTILCMFFSLILSFIYQFGSFFGQGTAIFFTVIALVFIGFLLISGYDLSKKS